MRSQLSEADQQKLTKGSTGNPEAYQLYLKGKYYTNKFTRDGFRKGIDYFNQAIAIISWCCCLRLAVLFRGSGSRSTGRTWCSPESSSGTSS